MPFSLTVRKIVNKPIFGLYPKKLESIGDHLRKKRLDLKLRQKDLIETLGVCQANILLWETNKTEPRANHIPKINNFLNYCLTPQEPVLHFGHQLRLYRINILGYSIFELACKIGIDESTLNEIEKTSIIKHAHVLNAINIFLEDSSWNISDKTPTQFIPVKSKCHKQPRYISPLDEPKTLGDHIALRRKQLKLKQSEAMEMIGVISASAFGCWERNTSKIHIKYYPAIASFLGYCPIQYPKNEGEQLKIFREHLGLSYRQVDKTLNLSKGCTYRIEKMMQKDRQMVKKLWSFYKN